MAVFHEIMQRCTSLNHMAHARSLCEVIPDPTLKTDGFAAA
jgi:hypothetical protein